MASVVEAWLGDWSSLSLGLLRVSEVDPLLHLSHLLVVDGLVLEAGEGGLDVVPLPHVEVLSEVLVSAPPVSVDHAGSLVLPHLMEVGVPHIVLLAVRGEEVPGLGGAVVVVDHADVPVPLVDHTLLLVLGQHVERERLVEVPDEQEPGEAESVLGRNGHLLPEKVAEGVLHEASNVLEHPPLLRHVSGLGGLHNELREVAVGLLGQGPSDHVGSLVHVGVAVHEALDSGEALSEVRLGILSVVQVLRHFPLLY
mmetsp:Transcript_9679/g.16279  ORF Transcript_9679/g.16279 Transcript_9679/m.16279 type:complete len:254 (-) Transcript_9679:38-799(-)